MYIILITGKITAGLWRIGAVLVLARRKGKDHPKSFAKA